MTPPFQPVRVVQSVVGKFHHFDLARQLHRRGMLVKIFSGYPKRKLLQEGIPLSLIECHSAWLMLSVLWHHCGWAWPWLAGELAWRAHQQVDALAKERLPDCDVIVALSGSGLLAGKEAQGRGARYICDRGSTHIVFQDRLLRQEYQRWRQPYAGTDLRSIRQEEAEYEQCDCITVPSQFALNSFLQMGLPAPKMRKIPYGVDLASFSPGPAPAAGEFRILFVGQVGFRKGIPYLLRAFEQLRHPGKRLVVIGKVLPEIQPFLRSQSWPQVTFLGIQPREVVARYMRESHAFVLPSLEEGLALVLAQAMASGVVVLATPNSGAEDLIESGRDGFIVPAREVEMLSSRLRELAEDRPQWERMRQAAIQNVRQRQGWQAYGDQFASLCQEMVRKTI